jgi:uncharacterized protein (TIGR02246 family)
MDAFEKLLAREEIRDLLARYAIAFDDYDWDSWEKLWTQDVVFVVDGVPIEGLAALRAFMTTCLPADYRGKHMCSPSVIEIAPDGMTAAAQTDVVWIAQNFENAIVGRYVDTLVKRDGRWLIARREESTIPFKFGSPPLSKEAKELSGPNMRQ